jgi:hypothetical protein
MTYNFHGNRSNFLLNLSYSGIFQVYSCLFLKCCYFYLDELLFLFHLRSTLSKSTLSALCSPLYAHIQVSSEAKLCQQNIPHVEQTKWGGRAHTQFGSSELCLVRHRMGVICVAKHLVPMPVIIGPAQTLGRVWSKQGTWEHVGHLLSTWAHSGTQNNE